ncbi:unnamed protein product [Boreogadus saida]
MLSFEQQKELLQMQLDNTTRAAADAMQLKVGLPAEKTRPGPAGSRMGVCPCTGCVPVNGIKGGLAWRDAEREREI